MLKQKYLQIRFLPNKSEISVKSIKNPKYLLKNRKASEKKLRVRTKLSVGSRRLKTLISYLSTQINLIQYFLFLKNFLFSF